MKFINRNIYHVYNQGNNKEQLFFKDADYRHFISLYKSFVYPKCETLCWCLMPNHFHFMIYADDRCNETIKQGGLLLDPVTNGFRKLLSTYAHQSNASRERSGALFRPKTKSKCLTEETTVHLNFKSYIETCFHYIHQNPVESGLVKNAGEWKWSSARSFLKEMNDELSNKNMIEQILG